MALHAPAEVVIEIYFVHSTTCTYIHTYAYIKKFLYNESFVLVKKKRLKQMNESD